MKILNHITVQNLKMNKKRTVVTIIGIALSVALICAVTTFAVSFQQAMVNREIKTSGNRYININEINRDDLKDIENNSKVEQVTYNQEIGYVQLENSENEYKPYGYIEALDEKALNNMGLRLTEGRLPENENEILIPEHLESNGHIKYNIGDKIIFTVGNRVSEGYKLNQSIPYYTEEDIKFQLGNNMLTEENISSLKETFTPTESKEYTVVGIIKRPSFEPYSAPGYTMITKLDKLEENKSLGITILLKNPSYTYDFVQYLEEDLQISNVNTNTNLLEYLGVFGNNGTLTFVIGIITVVIIIILFTSAFVISNSFNISLTEKTRELGMISSIGATSKQIRKSIFFEGAILGLISIPLGIIIGVGAIGIVLSIVNNIINSGVEPLIDNFNLVLVISWPAILIAIFISIIMIIISLVRPSIRAGRISPIDAIREKSDIKITNRQLKKQKKNGNKIKEYKITKKLFGIEGVIARKNFNRSKKKYRTTIFSIFLSIVLFISMSSIMDSLFSVSSLRVQEMGYNLRVYSGTGNKTEAEDYFAKIGKLDGIKEYAIISTAEIGINQDIINPDSSFYSDIIYLYALNDECYNNYIKELGLQYDNIKDKAILYDTRVMRVQQDNKIRRFDCNLLNINEGDYIDYGTLDENHNLHVDGKIQIGVRTTTLPMDSIFADNTSPVLIVSNEFIKNFDYTVDTMYIDAEDPYELQNEIANIDYDNNGNIYNFEEQERANNNLSLIISIFLYGFIAVISVIGITNIFNTIATNMALRGREFAILKSIGMTDKEFKRMINYESFIYGLKALIFGLPVGVLLSYLIYNITGTVYEQEYHLPLRAIIISIIFVFVIIFITMQYSARKTKNQNIIETIKKENI